MHHRITLPGITMVAEPSLQGIPQARSNTASDVGWSLLHKNFLCLGPLSLCLQDMTAVGCAQHTRQHSSHLRPCRPPCAGHRYTLT